jgi:Arc/MetJ-type ribon-helix-helix transcriptional regulator
MSTEIVVRLPDAIVEFIDAEVGAGHSPSRAAFILRALEREHHRRCAARSAAVLAETEIQTDTGENVAYVGYRSVLWTDPVQRG